MRKFLIRWWFTPNWPQDRSLECVIRWNESGSRTVVKR